MHCSSGSRPFCWSIATMVWIVVGRALHPVEAIRAEVAGIGGNDLDRRVPVPATRDEIGRLATTMNEMLDRLEAASDRQHRFVSDASHELRTPIAVIRHELEVALAADRRQRRDVAGDRQRRSRRGPSYATPRRRSAVHGTTGRTCDRLRGRSVRRWSTSTTWFSTRSVAVTVDNPIDVSAVSAGQVRGDHDQLSRVVRNLLDNALRHASARVAVSVRTADGAVIMAVDDDGPGVDTQHAERVFERFGRADDARGRDDGGSGLGLAIVRSIVTDHGGTISVERSHQLGGASFIVRLPDTRSATA